MRQKEADWISLTDFSGFEKVVCQSKFKKYVYSKLLDNPIAMNSVTSLNPMNFALYGKHSNK